MSTELTTAGDAAYTQEQRKLISDVLCKGATPTEVEFFMQVATRCRLDPFRRQIHAVKRWDSTLKREALTFQVGIDGLRAIAARTGDYAGNDDPVFVLDDKGNPVKATVTVYRFVHGQRIPFSASVFWQEYCQTKRDGGLTSMWAQRPFGQLGKCAEAAALRKAFPEEAGQLYTEEEMEADASHEVAATKSAPQMPTTTHVTVRDVAKPLSVLGDAEAAQPSNGAHTVVEAEAATLPWSELTNNRWKNCRVGEGPHAGCTLGDLPGKVVGEMRQDGFIMSAEPALWEGLMASLYDSIAAALKKAGKTPADFEGYLRQRGAFDDTNTLLLCSSDDLPDMAENVKTYISTL